MLSETYSFLPTSHTDPPKLGGKVSKINSGTSFPPCFCLLYSIFSCLSTCLLQGKSSWLGLQMLGLQTSTTCGSVLPTQRQDDNFSDLFRCWCDEHRCVFSLYHRSPTGVCQWLPSGARRDHIFSLQTQQGKDEENTSARRDWSMISNSIRTGIKMGVRKELACWVLF